MDLLNEELSENYDIILIQEPYSTTFNMIRMPGNFRQVIPVNRLQVNIKIRSVIWVNKCLDTTDWVMLDVPESNNITAIQLKGPYGKLAIFNIYNDCTHSENQIILENYLRRNTNQLTSSENHHMMWAGDFN